MIAASGAAQPGLAAHMLTVFDDITIETDRSGNSIVEGIGGPVLDAAREPNMREGAYLSANDTQDFWPAVAQFHPALSAPAQQEWGLKQLKRQWFEFAWAHIATPPRSGSPGASVRMARPLGLGHHRSHRAKPHSNHLSRAPLRLRPLLLRKCRESV